MTPVPPVEHEVPSSDIVATTLITSMDVVQKYPNYRMESKMTSLAVKLAREAFFGDEILRRCTPRGWTNLPHDVLTTLKEELYHLYPSYWTRPECFKKCWAQVQDAIGQTCKCLRKKEPLQTLAVYYIVYSIMYIALT